MVLFRSDLEALIYLIIIGVSVYFAIKFISSILEKSPKIPLKQRIIINFFLRIIFVLIIVYFIIEGFPAISYIDPQYTAVLTGAISTAIAFASSGIFANIVAGIVLMIIRPFDVGDLIKIDVDKGIVRSIGLTKIVLETFDNILIEKSNAQIISSTVVNYTLKIGKKKNFEDFKKKILSPQDKGIIETNHDYFYDNEFIEEELKNAYELFSAKNYPVLFNYTFRMSFPYKGFKKSIKMIENLCQSYQDKKIFRLKPRYDIVDFALNIIVKFRILTFDSEKIFNHQPQFAQEIFDIISHQL